MTTESNDNTINTSAFDYLGGLAMRNNFRSLSVCFAICLVLAACISPRAERERVARENIQATCASYGLEVGSPNYQACVGNGVAAHEAQTAARRARSAAEDAEYWSRARCISSGNQNCF